MNLVGNLDYSENLLAPTALEYHIGSMPSQMIPNPNQDRLGLPDLRPPDPRIEKARKEQANREAHRRVLAYAHQILSLATQLRDSLKDEALTERKPLRKQAGQIEKLARKLRSELSP